MSGHKGSVGNPYGPICEVCGVALGTELANQPCGDPKDAKITQLKERALELESLRSDDLVTLTRVSRKLGVERSQHTLGTIIELLEARVAELEGERDAARAEVGRLRAAIDKYAGSEGPCNEDFVDDTDTPYCSDRDCTYCELVSSTDESSSAWLYHEQRERKEGE